MEATEVLRQHAAVIADACQAKEGNQVIAAMVGADGSFAGTQVFPRAELQDKLEVLEVQEQKWVMTLAPNASVSEIERRCSDIRYYANRRRNAILRRLDQQDQQA
jgi:hypothetical protein